MPYLLSVKRITLLLATLGCVLGCMSTPPNRSHTAPCSVTHPPALQNRQVVSSVSKTQAAPGLGKHYIRSAASANTGPVQNDLLSTLFPTLAGSPTRPSQQQIQFQQAQQWQAQQRLVQQQQIQRQRIQQTQQAGRQAMVQTRQAPQTTVIPRSTDISQVSYQTVQRSASGKANPDLYKPWDVESQQNTSASGRYRLVSDIQESNAPKTSPPSMTSDRLLALPKIGAVGQDPETRRASMPILGIGRDLVHEFRPSNDRKWSQNHAILQTAEFNGNFVTIRNIRYSKYSSTAEYTTQYYDATFNLEEIRSIDLVVVPFHAMPSLAHVQASFGFADGRHIGLSIEARYEEGEKYDPVAAAMRQFELIYVLADERDLIRIGSAVNKNDVHLYRLKFEPGEVREMFVDALQRANKLAQKPEFYHPLRNSCVTNLMVHINKGRPKAIPREYRTLLPGLMDHYVYDLKLVDTTAQNFKEAKENAKVNWLVEKYGDLEYFSAGIRQNLY